MVEPAPSASASGPKGPVTRASVQSQESGRLPVVEPAPGDSCPTDSHPNTPAGTPSRREITVAESRTLHARAPDPRRRDSVLSDHPAPRGTKSERGARKSDISCARACARPAASPTDVKENGGRDHHRGLRQCRLPLPQQGWLRGQPALGAVVVGASLTPHTQLSTNGWRILQRSL